MDGISDKRWPRKHAIHQECCDEWHDTTISMQTVGNGAHTVLTNTISDVCASIVSESCAGGLEVDSSLYLGQVTACQIGRATHEIGECGRNRRKDKLRQLARCLSRIGRGVHREGLLPSFREFPRNPASEFCVFLGVCFSVLREKAVPLGLELSTAKCSCAVGVVSLLRHVEFLVRRESEFALQGLDVIGLESWGENGSHASA
jgi:hypothetical protein